MADEQKPPTDHNPPSNKAAGANISPAPTDFDDKKKTDPGQPDDGRKPGPGPTSEPLSDGTVPTVLTPGDTHISVPKSKTSITTIYRKADIMTTLLTFLGAALAAGVLLGGYAYLTGHKGKPTPSPKVTSLNSTDLKSLNDFFNGNSSGSGASQVLTVSSPSLFNSRVGVASDLKVTGGVSVDGPTSLGGLTVDQQSTLGVTDIRGSLTVGGPVNLQSPATLSGGGTVTGNLAVSGNGSFGGSIAAGVINVNNLSVSGTLSLNGHLSIGGRQPSVSSSVGSTSVQGDDSAGAVTVSISSSAHTSPLVTVNFSAGYQSVPVVIITPIGQASAAIEPYVSATANSFSISGATSPVSPGTYAFNYWVVQY